MMYAAKRYLVLKFPLAILVGLFTATACALERVNPAVLSDDILEMMPDAKDAWLLNVSQVEPEADIGEALFVSYYTDPIWEPGGCVSVGRVFEMFRESASEPFGVIDEEEIALGHFALDASTECREVDTDLYFALDTMVSISEAAAAANVVKYTQHCLLGSVSEESKCLGEKSELFIDLPMIIRYVLHIDAMSPKWIHYEQEDGSLRFYYEVSRDYGITLIGFIVFFSEQEWELRDLFLLQLEK